jgi:hypothetical protein
VNGAYGRQPTTLPVKLCVSLRATKGSSRHSQGTAADICRQRPHTKQSRAGLRAVAESRDEPSIQGRIGALLQIAKPKGETRPSAGHKDFPSGRCEVDLRTHHHLRVNNRSHDCWFRSNVRNPPQSLRVVVSREATAWRLNMPVLLIPVLWAVGGIVVLGGGYYVIAHVIH